MPYLNNLVDKPEDKQTRPNCKNNGGKDNKKHSESTKPLRKYLQIIQC